MRKTKNFIKKTAILGIAAIGILITALTTDATASSAAKTQTAGDYEVTKLKIRDYSDDNVNVFKVGNKGVAAVIREKKEDSKGRYVYDKKGNNILESYKITWSESGKAKKTKIAKAGGYLLKSDDKGRLFYFVQKEKGKYYKDYLYVCDSKGKRIKDIEVSKIRKFYIPDEERNIYDSTGLIDFEVKGKYIDILMTEFVKDNYHEKVYSLQRFNWKTGKLVKAYRLKYGFERIIDGKLYGVAYKDDEENNPIESGYYVFNKSGKKCLYQKEGKYSYYFDVVDDKLIYHNAVGVYTLDMSNNTEPKLLIATEDFSLFSKSYNWAYIYAMSEDKFYITYSTSENICDEIQSVYKFKKK